MQMMGWAGATCPGSHVGSGPVTPGPRLLRLGLCVLVEGQYSWQDLESREPMMMVMAVMEMMMVMMMAVVIMVVVVVMRAEERVRTGPG